MATNEQNEYILGTNEEELHRLGLQHQIWASEAHLGWSKAGFNVGQTILDLGCGPGFCTKELAYIVGDKGKVIGVDKSENYIQFLQKTAELHSIPIDAIHSDFNNLLLESNSLDAMYCRWALAWISNPTEILQKVLSALKPGGKMVIQEYFDWSTHQTQPSTPALSKAIAACLQSFKEQEGDIDVGREVPQMLESMGMKILSTRIMAKLANPKELTWQWPKSFYHVYFPRLVEMNYLTQQESEQALKDMEQLGNQPSSQLYCPSLIEIIAEKV
ncbi:MAG: methyltransferase domain-containing protein [Bacteroidia bacterium]|nr:methyltransferase domain-containing protein [Bacteroidia bacterium]NNJ56113.1 methyltransferase domain-containing protein [Bacteroidia bacterium]